MTLKKISAEELFLRIENQEQLVLLDVRAEEKYNDYHIEDSSIENINIPKTEILEGKEDVLHSLPNGKEMIVTCTTGNSATRCATILSDKEYDVVVLDGGITAWKKYLETK
ncbi:MULTISPECIES: rhodanese-like domain-containing protein [unclassified Bacillus (in: firmicutes)]|uniref:rhodanese-like domain-containing protein n=1 Tax=unclassified Bacillus (in: firmicutes) TaxID=185979 RepID=UPI0008E8B78C|nr:MULTISPECIES: rhodanese-like domain-containing protein [unclassified Bacillus (in: firmicutes)]SFB09151.1 Rhodanese-related sulfurtransferase [Bacillus sp. UNCCL13]SFQ86824.1 Rhodanese-related sulfurtransferase [Bacillus sp. cl95]